jgi:hypothetical protein
MHDHGTDVAIQRAVLSLVLAEHPKPLTILTLAREIDEGDATERAVVALVGVGLLDCGGISVKPTPAAVHFDQLGL